MAKMFQEETLEKENSLVDVDGGEDLQAAWKAWISAEERKRYFSCFLSIKEKGLLNITQARVEHIST
jgi:hypothetical protein